MAAVRENVDRRGAAPARAAGQASGFAGAGRPDRAAPAAGALALTPVSANRATKSSTRRRGARHRGAALSGEAQGMASAPYRNVGGGPRRGHARRRVGVTVPSPEAL